MKLIGTTLGSRIFMRSLSPNNTIIEKHFIGEFAELASAVEAINVAIIQSLIRKNPSISLVPYSTARLANSLIVTAPLYKKTLTTHEVSSIEELREYVSQIGGAVSFLHQNGILHRDIKADNIFVGVSGNYFLGDFGSAKLMPSATNHTDGRTTRAYEAPELIRDGVYTEFTDIWAFGCTIFWLQHRREFDSRKFENYESAMKYLTTVCNFDDRDSANTFAVNRYMNLDPASRKVGVFSGYEFRENANLIIRVRAAIQKISPINHEYFCDLYFDEPRSGDQPKNSCELCGLHL